MRVESIENEITYNHKNQKIYSFCLRVERKSFADGDGGGDPEWLSFGPKQASQKKIAKVCRASTKGGGERESGPGAETSKRILTRVFSFCSAFFVGRTSTSLVSLPL